MKTPVKMTNKLAKAIREARQQGRTERECMILFDVSAWTVRFHSSDANRKQMLAYEKRRYERNKLDPVKLEKRRADQRIRQEAYRQRLKALERDV